MNRPNLNSKGESSKANGFGAAWMALTENSVPWWFHDQSDYPDNQ